MHATAPSHTSSQAYKLVGISELLPSCMHADALAFARAHAHALAHHILSP